MGKVAAPKARKSRDMLRLEKLREAADLLDGALLNKEGSVNYYMKVLEKDGAVEIPCPYGMGFYKIRLEGSAWYETAEVVWINDEEKNPGYGRDFAPQFAKTNEGRAIPWWPKGMGLLSWTESAESDKNDRLMQAKIVMGIIISGRKLWKMKCGQNINSLNTDDSPYDGYY